MSNEAPTAATPGPRVLVLSASVGAGHMRAAHAIQGALTRLLPGSTLDHVDALTLTNFAFRRFYNGGYTRAVAKTPHLVGAVYDMLDRPVGQGRGEALRQFMERVNFRRLAKLITDQPWDLIVCTHFLPAAIVANLRRNGEISIPTANVVTDFDVHGLWITDPCERLFVATEEARAVALGAGVAEHRVSITGIPIDPAFSRAVDREEICWKHNLDPTLPMVLQMGGGFGMGPLEQIYLSLRKIGQPVQLVTVAGKNERARAALERFGPHDRHACRVLGFTTDMHELMAAAEVIVTKPGGLTTSEALARGCAMVVVDPIPGQEERNSDYLLEGGAAIRVNNLNALTHKVDALLADPARLTTMRRSATRLARPHAASDVALQCVGLLAGRAFATVESGALTCST